MDCRRVFAIGKCALEEWVEDMRFEGLARLRGCEHRHDDSACDGGFCRIDVEILIGNKLTLDVGWKWIEIVYWFDSSLESDAERRKDQRRERETEATTRAMYELVLITRAQEKPGRLEKYKPRTPFSATLGYLTSPKHVHPLPNPYLINII